MQNAKMKFAGGRLETKCNNIQNTQENTNTHTCKNTNSEGKLCKIQKYKLLRVNAKIQKRYKYKYDTEKTQIKHVSD